MRRQLVRLKWILESATTVAMGIAAVFMIVRMWDTTPGADAGPRRTPRVLEDIGDRDLSTSVRDAAIVGSDAAPVVLVEYSDFECPFCARHARETFGQIQREFVSGGRVQYVFRHYPLERIHHSAVAAARAAVCAHQNRFMDMRSYFFANQQTIASIDMSEAAAAIGLDKSDFASCLMETGPRAIEEEKKEASRLGVSSTPTFFIGRRQTDGAIRLMTKINGALDYSSFKGALESAITR
jgi:protein-disulfide isomerase